MFYFLRRYSCKSNVSNEYSPTTESGYICNLRIVSGPELFGQKYEINFESRIESGCECRSVYKIDSGRECGIRVQIEYGIMNYIIFRKYTY